MERQQQYERLVKYICTMQNVTNQIIKQVNQTKSAQDMWQAISLGSKSASLYGHRFDSPVLYWEIWDAHFLDNSYDKEVIGKARRIEPILRTAMRQCDKYNSDLPLKSLKRQHIKVLKGALKQIDNLCKGWKLERYGYKES